MKSYRRAADFFSKKQGEQLNTVARLMVRKNDKLILKGFAEEGIVYAPDRRSLRRFSWRDGECCRCVFVTRVVSNKIPGVKFCIFRPLEPRDVCASTKLGLNVPFHESIRLKDLNSESLVFSYQASIGDFCCLGMKSREFEISFNKFWQQIELQRLLSEDREFQGQMFCAWSFSICRSGIVELGSDQSHHGKLLQQTIWIEKVANRTIKTVLQKYHR